MGHFLRNFSNRLLCLCPEPLFSAFGVFSSFSLLFFSGRKYFEFEIISSGEGDEELTVFIMVRDEKCLTFFFLLLLLLLSFPFLFPLSLSRRLFYKPLVLLLPTRKLLNLILAPGAFNCISRSFRRETLQKSAWVCQ